MKIRAFHIIVLIGILLIAAFLIIPKLNLGEGLHIYSAIYPEALEGEPGDDRIVLVNAAKEGCRSSINIARLPPNPESTYIDFIEDLPVGMVYIDIDKTFLRQFDSNYNRLFLSLSPENFSTIPAASLERYVTEEAIFEVFDAETSYMSNISESLNFFSMSLKDTGNASISLAMYNNLEEEIETNFKIKYKLNPSMKNVQVTEIDSDIFEAAYLVKYKVRSPSTPNNDMEQFIFYGYIPLEKAVEYYYFSDNTQNITPANLSSYVKTYKYLVVVLETVSSDICEAEKNNYPFYFTERDMQELVNNLVVKK